MYIAHNTETQLTFYYCITGNFLDIDMAPGHHDVFDIHSMTQYGQNKDGKVKMNITLLIKYIYDNITDQIITGRVDRQYWSLDLNP